MDLGAGSSGCRYGPWWCSTAEEHSRRGSCIALAVLANLAADAFGICVPQGNREVVYCAVELSLLRWSRFRVDGEVRCGEQTTLELGLKKCLKSYTLLHRSQP